MQQMFGSDTSAIMNTALCCSWFLKLKGPQATVSCIHIMSGHVTGAYLGFDGCIEEVQAAKLPEACWF